jgi:hypothetical protein
MPIRLNLLAEAQAEEELRRRDPVKRSIWLAGLLVCCVLVWSGILLIKSFTLRSTLNQIESRLGGQNNRYQQIVENQKHLAEVQQRLQALHRLAANRFLWGNVLNALQQATLDDVQLNRFRSAQNYTATEETKPKTSESGRVTLAKPGFVTQRITFYFDAKDISATPGDRIGKYKEALINAPFFGKRGAVSNEITLTLKNLSPPTYDPETSRSAVSFSLECKFADKIIQ